MQHAPTAELMIFVAQLRGGLLKLRDELVVKFDVDASNDLYKPLHALNLKQLQSMFDYIPDDIASKHFDFDSYKIQSRQYRKNL
jgi:hypothetical protein